MKNILFILGVILLLRFIGKMMTARRNITAQKQHQKNRTSQETEKNNSKRNLGKTSIHKLDEKGVDDSEYTSYEEVD